MEHNDFLKPSKGKKAKREPTANEILRGIKSVINKTNKSASRTKTPTNARSKRSTSAKTASSSYSRKQNPFLADLKPCEALSADWYAVKSNTIFPRNDESGSLEFKFRGDQQEFIHPLMLLNFSFKVLRENGDTLEEKMVNKPDGTVTVQMDKVAPLNFFQNTLWKQVEVRLNNTLITPSENAHAAIAYLSLLEDFPELARNNMFETALYAKDDTVYVDAEDPTALTASVNFKWRTGCIKKSNVCQVDGPLFINGLTSGKHLIPPGIDITVTLRRATNAFALLTPSSNKTKYKISIMDAQLLVYRIRPKPKFTATYTHNLFKYGFSVLPLLQKETKVLEVESGTKKVNFLCFEGQLPSVTTVVMQQAGVLDGDFHKNGLAFEHFGLTSIGFEANGRRIPADPLEVDFTNGKYTNLYYQTLLALYGPNEMLGNVEFPIGYEDFRTNQTIMSFRTSPYVLGCPMPAENGLLRLSMEFGSGLTKAITIIVIGSMMRAAMIGKSGDIMVVPQTTDIIEQLGDHLAEHK